MRFRRKRKYIISINEMRALLKHLSILHRDYSGDYASADDMVTDIGFSKMNYYVVQKLTTIEVTFKWGTIPCTCVCSLNPVDMDEDATKTVVSGLDAYREAQKVYKVDKLSLSEVRKLDIKAEMRSFTLGRTKVDVLHHSKKHAFSAVPILYQNDKYNNQRIDNCVGYDMNSAYAYALSKSFIDATRPLGSQYITLDNFADIAGFDVFGNKIKYLDVYNSPNGVLAQYSFPIIESPYKDYVSKRYTEKCNATNERAKSNAKGMINSLVGYWQNINPFLRSYIVGCCNDKMDRIRYIVELEGLEVLYMNTDSIVTNGESKFLSQHLSNEIGDFKIEHRGAFAHVYYAYQWDLELPKYRGVPKAWFKPGWDILKDSLPDKRNVFSLSKSVGVDIRHNNYDVCKIVK